MKLSLAWIFSHIKKTLFHQFSTDYENGDFFEQLGASVAEIEHVQKVTYSPDSYFYAIVQKIEKNICTLIIPELNNKEVKLAVHQLAVGDGCLLKLDDDTLHYATLKDFYAEKEGLLPALCIPIDQQAGAWKKAMPLWDYILTIDNKALTHRPDLWGHRGFAREIAALYDLELVPDEHIITQKPIRSFVNLAHPVAGNKWGLTNNSPKNCTRIAGLTLSKINSEASRIDMVVRLCAINAKPINAVVDCTNYVMYDIGQPMHAFDNEKLTGDSLMVRQAFADEQAVLLDGTQLTLTPKDTVIADKTGVIALAGIMGSKATAVSPQTKSIFIESAHYQPGVIRTSALHHKLRTEASTRFEKFIDPLANTQALMRFLHLLDEHDIPYEGAEAILLLGSVPDQKKITFLQSFIQEKIGMIVSLDQIHTILHKLGFGIQQKDILHDTEFTVIVPTFRATKDIRSAQDIVEEIARFIGFNNLPMQLPTRTMRPFSLHAMHAQRQIKRLCAFGFSMHEVSNYAFYDNQFLEKIALNLETAYRVANPVSEHWTMLVSSLIPHLFKNIEQNIHQHAHMAFFEINNIWKKNNEKPDESLMLAAVWYQEEAINFYDYKEKIIHLCKELSITLLWKKPDTALDPWYHPYQTAELIFNNQVIGYAGVAHPSIMRKIAPGSAFIFEISLTPIITQSRAPVTFKPLSIYQPVTTDISLLVPLNISVDTLEQAIAQSDARIYAIQLIDYFENEAFVGKRAITFRYSAQDDEKTFSKTEIEQLRNDVIAAVAAQGVTIR